MALSSSENTSESSEAITITESQRHRLLSSERRRTLLDVLAGQSTPIDVDTLASAIAEEERDRGTQDPSSMDQIAVVLHHNHLPKLEEVDVVDYDRTSNQVVSFQDRIPR